MRQQEIAILMDNHFIGVIESRLDPLQLGRHQVRIYGIHTEDKTLIPTDELFWAITAYPINNNEPYPSIEATWVIGYWLDNESKQMAIITHSLPGIPETQGNTDKGFNDPRSDQELEQAPKKIKTRTWNTDGSGITLEDNEKGLRYPSEINKATTSKYARNDIKSENIVQEKKSNKVTSVPSITDTWNEPETPYNPTYPYNRVIESESGHLIEIDDTPKSERIHVFHRSGSFIEIHPDGTIVAKTTKDRFEIVMKDDHLYVMGDSQITVQGNSEIYVKKDLKLKVDQDVTIDISGESKITCLNDVLLSVEGNVSADVNGDAAITVSGDVSLTNQGDLSITAGGDISFSSGGSFTISCDSYELST